MTHTIKNIFLVLGAAVLIWGGAAAAASAQVVSGNLEVQFQNMPLFSEAGVVPGTVIARTVTVTNNGSDTEAVYTSLDNATSTGLAEFMVLSIMEDGATVYLATTTFDSLFTADPIALGSLGGGDSRTYTYRASLPSGVSGAYMNSSMGFDLIIGFEGGASVSDGGGGGGGGSNNDQDEEDEEDDLPPGIIAGETTSLPASVIGAVNDFVRGLVRGEGTSTETEDDATTTDDGITEAIGEPNRTSSPAAILFDETYCTLVWLLILGFMLLGWSAYEDKFRFGGEAFNALFLRNAIFTGVYSALLVLFHVLGLLAGFWWLFAGAWVIMAVLDYRAHDALLPLYDTTYRTAFYGGVSALLILTSFLFGFPCDWWPFLIIMVTSGLLYIFNET